MTKTIEKVGRVSTASVFKGTDKHWDQWVKLLDRKGAKNWTHQEIVAFLKTKYKLGPWWQQGVATGYEMVIGRKIEGLSKSNGYSITVTKTFQLGRKELWNFLFSPDGLACWLKPLSHFTLKPGAPYEAEDGIFGEVRTLKSHERIRMTWNESEWPKPSIVQIMIVPRKKNKTILVFQHEKLPDGRWRLKMRDHWKQVLAQLAALP